MTNKQFFFFTRNKETGEATYAKSENAFHCKLVWLEWSLYIWFFIYLYNHRKRILLQYKLNTIYALLVMEELKFACIYKYVKNKRHLCLRSVILSVSLKLTPSNICS